MAKKKNTVTNAMRMLSSKKIPFEAFEYEADEIGDGFGSKICRELGTPPEKTFKTLVGIGDKTGPVVAVIPVDEETDLKKLAKASKNKSVSLVHVKDLVALTGYARGSVSPLGMKKLFPTYVNISAENSDVIYISGGMCGLTLKLSPGDLIKVVNGEFADIIMNTEN